MPTPTRPRPASPARRPAAPPTLRPISLAVCLLAAAPASFGTPQGAVPTFGQTSVRQTAPGQLEILQSTARAGLDWTSFSIAAGERVNIVQPDRSSVLLNRVVGENPSLIYGALQSNGSVWLVNPRGIVFGAGSSVNVGSLVASTLSISQADLASGRLQLAAGAGGAGELRSEGQITATDGTVVLAAPQLLHSGQISARRVGLVAASEVLVDVEGDGLIFFNARNDRLDTRLALLGGVRADGGTAEIRAAARAGFADTVLNLEGVVQARSLGQRNGRIVIDGGGEGITRLAGTLDASGRAAGETGGDVLVQGRNVMLDSAARADAAGDQGGGRVRVGGGFQGLDADVRNAENLIVRRGAQIDASALARGDGGEVVLWSDATTRFHGEIRSTGGALGGNGGQSEVSGKRTLEFNGDVDQSAAAGHAGRLLLDPDTITISDAGTPIDAAATVNFADGPPNNPTFRATGGNSVQSLLRNTDVVLQARDTIRVASSITPHPSGVNNSLTLEAGGDITIDSGTEVTAVGITLSANKAGGNNAAGTGRVVVNGSLNAVTGTLKITNNGGTGTHQIGAALGGNTLDITGAVELTAAQSWTIASATTVSSNLSGAGSLEKLGAGTLTLSGSNSYAGATTVTTGTLKLGAANALPGGAGKGDVVVNGSLDLNGFNAAVRSLSGTGIIDSTAVGPPAPTPTLTIGADGGTGTFSGVIRNTAGSLSLIKTGGGTINLAGANSYTGTTAINQGTLGIGAAGNLGSGALSLNGGTLGASDDITLARAITLGAGGGGFAVANGKTLNLSQAIGGTGGLSKSGTGSLRLGVDNSYGGNTVVGAGTLTLGSAGAIPGGASAGNVTVDGTLDLNGFSPTFNGLSGASTGIIDSTAIGPPAPTPTLTVGANNGSGTYDGVIANTAGTLSLTKTGSGTITLTGANTYAGTTVVEQGTLRIAAAGSLGAGGLTLDGGTLGASADIALAKLITLGAAGGGFDVANNRTLTLSQAVGGAGALTKTGAGTLVLGADNSAGYTGTFVNAGTLGIGAANNLGQGGLTLNGGTLAASADINLAKAITLDAGGGSFEVANGRTLTLSQAIGGAGALTKTGAGTLVLGANNSAGYTGTTVNSGTLGIGAANNLGQGGLTLDGGTLATSADIALAKAITLDAGGSFDVANGTTLTLSQAVGGAGALTKAGAGTLVLGANNSAGYTGTFVNAGTLGIGAANNLGQGALTLDGGTLATSADIALAKAITLAVGGGSFDVANATTLTLSQAIGGAGALTKSGGAGTLVLGANNSAGYTGTTVNAGTLAIGAANNLGQGGLTLNGGTLATSADINLAKAITLDAGGGSFDVANGRTLTLSQAIGGAGALSKAGAGTLVLGANNSAGYTGTIVNAGTLGIGAANNLGQGGLTLDGGTLAASADINLAKAITLDAGGGRFDVANGRTLTLSQAVGGAGALSKTGAGTLVLSADNSAGYTGTTVNAGTLGIGAANNLGQGGLTLNGGTLGTSADIVLAKAITLEAAGGRFDVANGTSLTLSQAIGGAGALTKTGAGTLVLGADNSAGYTGTFVNAGTLGIGAANNLGQGGLTLNGGTLGTSADIILAKAITLDAGGGSFDVAAGRTLSLSQAVDGSGALTKSGTGTVVLGAVNGYAGLTTIGDGTLRLGVAGALPGGAGKGNVVVNGTLDLNGIDANIGALSGANTGVIDSTAPGTPTLTIGLNNGAGSYAGIIRNTSGTLSLTKTGSGTIALGGAGTYGGTTRINQGTLRIVAANNLGSGGLRLDGGTLGASADIVLAKAITLDAGGGSFDVANGRTLNLAQAVVGAGALATSGTGTLVLGAVNTYGGATTIGAGTLRLGVANALPSGVGQGDVVVNGTLDLNGFSTAVRTLSGASTGIVDSSGAGAATLTVGADDGSGSFDGVIRNTSGTLSLTKIGSGTFTLGGANTYTGTTTVEQGTLRIGAANNLGTGGLTLDGGTLGASADIVLAKAITLDAGGGSFDVADGRTLTLSQAITGAGTLRKSGGTGTLVLGADNAAGYTGTTVSAGTLRIGAANNLGAGGLTLDGGTLGASADIDLAKLITLGAAGGGFDVANGRTLTLSQTVGGAGALSKSGTGTLVLGADNSAGYTGTTVNAGTLRIGAANNLGQGGLTLDGGTLGASADIVLAKAIALDAGGGSFDVANGRTLTLSQTVGGAGALSKSGTGTLVLGANNSAGYTGTTVNAGTLGIAAANNLGQGGLTLNGGTLATSADMALANAVTLAASGGSFDVANGTTLTLSQTVGGAGALTKTGAGTLVLGANNSAGYTGTIVDAGTLGIGAANNLGQGGLTLDGGTLAASADINLAKAITLDAGGGSFDVANGRTLTLSQAVGGAGALTKTGAGTLVLGANNSAGYTGTIVDAGTLGIGAANNLGQGGLTLNGGTLGASADINLAKAITLDAGGGSFDVANGRTLTLTQTVGGAGALTKTGAGTLALGANNAAGYTGTIVNAGTLGIGAANNLGQGGLTLNGGTLAASADINLAKAITLDAGGGRFDVANGRTLTLSQAVGGAGALTKTGAGTLVLSADNSAGYTGTTVNAGTLGIGAANNLGQGGLTLNGGTLGTSADIVLAKAITLEAAGGSFDVANGTSLTLSQAIGGAGALRKSGGSGTLALTADNAAGYTGTTVSAGTLRIAAPNNLGQGGLTLDGGTLAASADIVLAKAITLEVGGGNLDVANGTSLTLSQTIGGPGALRKSGGSGTLALTADNAAGYTGTTVQSGTLQIGAANNLGQGGLTLDGGTLAASADIDLAKAVTLAAGGGRVDVADGRTLTLTQAMAGAGTLTKSGGGRVVLTADSGAGFSGAVDVVGGTLGLSGAAARAGTGTLSVGANTLDIANGAFVENDLNIGDGGSVTSSGGGGTLAAAIGSGLPLSLGDNVGIRLFSAGGTLTVARAITDTNGNGRVSIDGGNVRLTGANSYGGGTTVNVNTLRIDGQDGRLGSGTINIGSNTLDITNGAVVDNAVVVANGGRITSSVGGGTLAGAAALNLGDGVGITLSGGANSLLGLTRPITDTQNNATVSIGTGTVRFGVDNSYGGGTTLRAGATLVLGNGGSTGSLGSGDVTLLDGATLRVNRNDTFTLGQRILGALAGNGALEQVGTGTLVLTGSNTYGDTLVSSGVLQLGNGGSSGTLGSGSVSLLGPGRLVVDHDDTLAIGAVFSGEGTLEQRGSGVTVLTADSSAAFTGAVEVTGGSLRLSGNAARAGTGTIALGSHTLDIADGAVVANVVTVSSGASITNSNGEGTLAANAVPLQLADGDRLNLSSQGDGLRIDRVVTGGNAGTSVVIDGPSAVRLGAGNTYGGTTLVNSGTLALLGPDVLPDGGTVRVAGNATLALGGDDRIGQLELAGLLDGSGVLTAATYALDSGTVRGALGAGALTSNGDSLLAAPAGVGTLTVDGGTLRLQGGSRLGAEPAVTLGAGTLLTLGADETFGTLAGTGTLDLGTSTLRTGTRGDSVFGGVLRGDGRLTKVGDGIFTLGGSSLYAGATTVEAGTLATSAPDRLPDGSAVVIARGATLALGGDDRVDSLTVSGTLDGNATLSAFTYLLDGGTANARLGTGSLTSQGTSTLVGTAGARNVMVESGELLLASADRLADDAIVGVATRSTLRLTGDETIRRLELAGTLQRTPAGTGTLTAADYLLRGGSVEAPLGTGALSSSFASTLAAPAQVGTVLVEDGALTLRGAARLGAAPAVALQPGARLVLGGGETLGSLAGGGLLDLGNHTLRIGTGADTEFTGVLSGAGSLVKEGASRFTLVGDNTYLGTTTVEAGTLAVGGTLASQSLRVEGGTLALTAAERLPGNAIVSVDDAGTFQLAAAQSIRRLALSGTLSGPGKLTAVDYALDGGRVLAALGTGALTSVNGSRIDGSADVSAIDVDGGTLSLGASARLTAAPAVDVASGATLALASDQTIGALSGPGTVDLGSAVLSTGQRGDSSFAGVIGGSGGLVKQGLSTFTLAGANTYTGTTRVDAGTLQLAAPDRLADGSTLSVGREGTLALAGHDETVASATIAGRLTGTGTLTTLSTTLDGGLVIANLGSGALFSRGASTLQGRSAAATVRIDDGMLTLPAADRFSERPALTIAGGATLQLGGDQTLGSLAGAGTAALADHQLSTGFGADSVFGGSLTGSDSSVLVKDGASTFGFAGVGSFTGLTRVRAGTLAVSGTLASGTVAVDGGTLALAGAERLIDTAKLSVGRDATLTLAGNETVSTLTLAGALAGSGTLGTTDGTTLDGGTATADLGTGTLVSRGNSRLDGRSGADTVTVETGSLTLGAANRLSDGAAVTVAARATLVLDTSDTVDTLAVAGTLAGAGTFKARTTTLDGGQVLAQLADGVLSSTGASTLAGTAAVSQVQVQSGTLTLATAQRLTASPAVDVAANGLLLLGGDQVFGTLAGQGELGLGRFTLSTGATGDSTFSGVLSGSGGLVKQGSSSVFTLSGANTYTGVTRVAAGTLRLEGGNAAGPLSSTAFEVDGTLVFARSGDLTLSQSVGGSGSVEQAGSGRLLFTGANKSYLGETRVRSGELATGAAGGELSGASAVTVASGATLRLAAGESVRAVDADGAVVLGGNLTTRDDLLLRGAVTAAGDVTLSGRRIDAVNAGNQFGGAVSLTAGERVTLSAGSDGSGSRALTLGNVAVAAGGRIDAGLLSLAGGLNVGGGELDLVSNAERGGLAPTGDVLGRLVTGLPIAYAADTVVQGAGSRITVASGAGLNISTSRVASVQLLQTGNSFAGGLSVLTGTANTPWDTNRARLPGSADDQTTYAVQSRVRIEGTTVNVSGAGIMADVVDIRADRLATVGDSAAIVARLPFDALAGSALALPALTLQLTPESFNLAFPYGDAGFGRGLRVDIGSRAYGNRTLALDAGFITVLPRGGAKGATSVLLSGPQVNPVGGYRFFFAGAGIQGEIPVFYNGVLPTTPQVENSISATVAVSEGARKDRFEEAVRTENVAVRLRAGVIAEVGPAPSATQGTDGIRVPQICPPTTGLLRCGTP